MNRYGKKHQGHYSPWLVLAINVLRNDVGHATVQDYMCERYGCYLNFDQTRETYGVVEIPRNLANEIGITPATTQQPRLRTTLNRIMELSSLPVAKLFEAGYSTKQFRYKFLSICQGTLYAITAVHAIRRNFSVRKSPVNSRPRIYVDLSALRLQKTELQSFCVCVEIEKDL